MTKHFLLVNENGSDNIGDHAINEGLKTLLSEKGYTYESAPFSTKKQVQQASQQKVEKSVLTKLKRSILSIKPLFHFLWLQKNKALIQNQLNNQYDGIIIGGGQLILSGFAFPIAMHAWVKYAKQKNIPVYVAGVGCGENFLPSEVKLYKKALQQCDAIFVRETASIGKLKSYFNVEAEFCPDLAFGLTPLDKAQKANGIIVGMTDYAVYQRYKNEVTDNQYDTYDSYLNAWLNKTKSLIIDSEEPIYLASTTHKDAACNRDLYQLLKAAVNNPIELVDGVESLDQYRRLLSRSRVVFSGRMHSLILGKIEGCELKPWVISAKIYGFLDTYGTLEYEEIKRTFVRQFINKLSTVSVAVIGYSDYVGGSGTGTKGLCNALGRVDGVVCNKFFVKPSGGRNSPMQWIHDMVAKLLHVLLVILARDFSYRTVNIYSRLPVLDVFRHDYVFGTWIGNNTITLKELIRSDKHIFWRMSDEWAWLGTLHYNTTKKETHAIKKVNNYFLEQKLRLLSKSNVHVLAPSVWLKNSLLRVLPCIQERVHVLPNAVDSFWFYDFKPKEKSPNKIQILLIAKDLDEPRKGFDVFESLAAEFSSDYIQFCAVGSTKQRNVSGPVKHKGLLDKLALRELLSEPSIVLSIGNLDTSPNSILEAMAVGALPLVRKESGIVDYLPSCLDDLYNPTFDTRGDLLVKLKGGIRALEQKGDLVRAQVANHIRHSYSSENISFELAKIINQVKIGEK
ncbi:polysaccharide pyruvyl transferase family protein [Catenovulum adriaticum]|uniref:Polysaccharide pyruvyl transferase family protein n=1 Tax=Catenovulum adriaticum TaxID=2984846 RepID=A0ABY7AJG6_9ALTE|nr:polysaccharide pyruvyl transferase family protein [Catenovulum sp. TS8]WAJ69377.1 polysaccharide pyruvyl transferase family protein [Catenovulum sp. TS8]